MRMTLQRGYYLYKEDTICDKDFAWRMCTCEKHFTRRICNFEKDYQEGIKHCLRETEVSLGFEGVMSE